MIKINLLHQRKARSRGRGRPGAVSSGPPAPLMLFIAGGAVVALLVVFFAFHRPLMSERDDLEGKNKDLVTENKKLKTRTQNSRTIRAAFESELARQQATQRLKKARVSPAWMLWELGNVLTPGKHPQVTPEMQAELKDNPNRPWQDGWDPKHVWISSFEEKGGRFTMRGGAQSKGDVIELGLRLRASMFFGKSVSPTETDDVSDKDTGMTYHRFAIEGSVNY
ncbi:MAG TPA: PilN domain-containing protein [Kofleriaceae bacterium]|nr:PilN domain-containing protein [Kofleriaceae bacterium]